MITKAGEIIRDALTELTVQANERAIPAVDLQTGVRYLNRMMAGLDSSGVKLGYTLVSSPNDIVTVPAGAIEGMVFNLAVRLANGFDMPISNGLASMAATSLKTLYKLGVSMEKMAYPTTLPIGSGNEHCSGLDHFYGGCEGSGVASGDYGGCTPAGGYGTQIIQSPTPPENPTVGTLWLDTSEEL